jgi:hypothetical protein
MSRQDMDNGYMLGERSTVSLFSGTSAGRRQQEQPSTSEAVTRKKEVRSLTFEDFKNYKARCTEPKKYLPPTHYFYNMVPEKKQDSFRASTAPGGSAKPTTTRAAPSQAVTFA